MKRETFERMVVEGFALLPEWVREKVRNVAILIEEEPSENVRGEEELEPGETLLGLYRGIPLAERGEGYGVGATLPDTITLYQKPIEEEAREEGIEVAQVIAETLWHEVAHHFGMDESEVRMREEKSGQQKHS